jgi:hypothetical protein
VTPDDELIALMAAKIRLLLALVRYLDQLLQARDNEA